MELWGSIYRFVLAPPTHGPIIDEWPPGYSTTSAVPSLMTFYHTIWNLTKPKAPTHTTQAYQSQAERSARVRANIAIDRLALAGKGEGSSGNVATLSESFTCRHYWRTAVCTETQRDSLKCSTLGTHLERAQPRRWDEGKSARSNIWSPTWGHTIATRAYLLQYILHRQTATTR